MTHEPSPRESLRASSQIGSASEDDDLLEPEDIAVDLDAPEPPTVHEYDAVGHEVSPAEQLADVTPHIDGPDEAAEPRPGC